MEELVWPTGMTEEAAQQKFNTVIPLYLFHIISVITWE